MKKKIIGIKNLKYCEWMSRETNCFNAMVTVDDKDFCHAEDEGSGGCTYFYPLEDRKDYDPIDELDQWCKKNLPKWKSQYFKEPFDTTLESVVGKLVEDKLARGEYAK